MAVVREISVRLGLSVDKNGVWVKGDTEIKINVNENDNLQECFSRAFEVADDALFDKMKTYLEEDE